MNATFRKYYNVWTVLMVIVIFIVVYLSFLYPWMNRWGITDAEVTMALPGDGAAPGTITTSTRAVTIHAPASEVWKWVVQLGQERAGFYSNDWLENLVLSNIHNADEIRPEWQSHRQGDRVLGAGGAIYQQNAFWTIRAYEEGRATYLWGAVVVIPIDGETSRLYARTYNLPASGINETISKFSYDWMHFVMERGMLLGIKTRAEGTLGAGYILRAVSDFGWLVATVAMLVFLLLRRRNWWGLLPLAYALVIIGFTSDLWSAMAGFLWWGVIAAGFLAFGSGWWKGLALAAVLVILIFVLAPQPHIAFGIVFLLITSGIVGVQIGSQTQRLRLVPSIDMK